jgi:hypothetical protein
VDIPRIPFRESQPPDRSHDGLFLIMGPKRTNAFKAAKYLQHINARRKRVAVGRKPRWSQAKSGRPFHFGGAGTADE